jgi:hypothetical protein
MTTYTHAQKIKTIRESLENDLTKLILEYPINDWDWMTLSCNPLITLDFIDAHPEFPWHWGCVSSNQNLNIDYVIRHANREWNWDRVSANPSITWADVQAHQTLPFEYDHLASNPSISPDGILYRLSSKGFENLSRNPRMRWDIVHANLHRAWMFDWTEICSNPGIKWCDIYNNIDGDWWEMDDVSANPNITWKIVESHPNLDWNWSMLSANPGITWDDIRLHPSKEWDWDSVIENPNITLEIVESNNKPWDWYLVDYTMTSYDSFKTRGWVTGGRSQNPNLTFEDVKKGIEEGWRWDWFIMSSNRFVYDDRVFKRRVEEADKRYKSAFRSIWATGRHPVNICDISSIIESYMSVL